MLYMSFFDMLRFDCDSNQGKYVNRSKFLGAQFFVNQPRGRLTENRLFMT